MTYAIVFDASSCTGCKTCQVACKDKNNLPAGVLWRRVYEVTGGEWQQQGHAWQNTIFGYNLSLACNHCRHPKCAGVCPTEAFVIRPDGIVYIDTSRCSGCGYCAWACPYDAPVRDARSGKMTKCDLCWDYLDQGLLPVCVASCPMRCLDLVEVESPEPVKSTLALWEVPGANHPFPLPKYSRTEPHLVIKPHPSVKQAEQAAEISNREEVAPVTPRFGIMQELPLLLFTLLTQVSVGICAAFLFLAGILGMDLVPDQYIIPLLGGNVALVVSVLLAFFHLGFPGNARYMLNHLQKSWLSREILFLTLFGVASMALTGMIAIQTTSYPTWVWFAILSVLCGFALLVSEQNIYRLRTVPQWNTRRTLWDFVGTALNLGFLVVILLLPMAAPRMAATWLLSVCLAGLLVELLTFIQTPANKKTAAHWLRAILVLVSMLACLLVLFLPVLLEGYAILLIFLVVLIEEVIGRVLFYSQRSPGI